ncbi:hypothetical protein COV82_03730 [Candidatus Peregrinibacteria bacterium CG11_big_fil_rev_8_21_14_0_20_46_8]|nr:MAG: hypothetical protein COV82_03730 [Candidatus Peregrinibacteria bacterium CG11_big_fil_rev_8_21_14_0_20_46_8]
MFPYLQIQNRALESGDQIRGGVADKLAEFITNIFAQIPSWIAGGILFLLTFVAAKIVKASVEARISAKVDQEHEEIIILSGRISYFTTILIGITVALKVAGIDLTAVLAAVGFGIGFALRDLIMNFLAGVMILVSRQFTIGDIIKVGETTGKVVEIQTRATIIRAFDGTKVIVPNAEIFKNAVTSYTTNPTRRIEIPIYIYYSTNIKYAMKCALEIARQHPMVLKKPEPKVIAQEFDDSSINLSVRFWVSSTASWLQIKSEMMHMLHEQLPQKGIDAPYPIYHLETEADTKTDTQKAEELAAKGVQEMEAQEQQNTQMSAPNGNGSEAADTEPQEPDPPMDLQLAPEMVANNGQTTTPPSGV